MTCAAAGCLGKVNEPWIHFIGRTVASSIWCFPSVFCIIMFCNKFRRNHKAYVEVNYLQKSQSRRETSCFKGEMKTISHLFNSNKSATRWNNFPVYYPEVYLQLNMFRAVSRPSSGAQWLQWQPLVLPSYRGDNRAVFVVGHDYHHDTKVKPEAATAIIELLMMGGKTSETCWAVNKRQDNKLENCCIRLVIYLNCAMMHGLINLKP